MQRRRNVPRILTSEPHQCVRVQENTFAVLRESPTVEFGEGDPQVRPLHHGQVRRVAAVENVHHSHLVKNFLQHGPKKIHITLK